MNGEIVYWSTGAEELYGFTASEAVGRRSHELLKTRFPEALEVIEQTLLDKGEWRGRLRHTARDGREIWTESLWRCREPTMVVEQNTDVTERAGLERQRNLLMLELDHRVKNTLAIVQGLARMTFGEADGASLRQFEERLLALSEAHKVLMRRHWEDALLKELIRNVTRGLNVGDRVAFEGPDVRLTPGAAVSYALALHELCTNALKYGALQEPSGRVEISWSFVDDREQHIRLVWRERDGPKVVPPQREGFGSRLIRRALAGELGTPVTMRFEEAGLVCEFDGPVQKSPKLP